MVISKPKLGGRPRGSIDQVLQDKEFGLDQFAAVKSFLFGIDPLVAARRYMLTDDAPPTTEAAVKRLGQIMARIAARGNSRSMGLTDAKAAVYSAAAASIDRVAKECLESIKVIAAKRGDELRAKKSQAQVRANEQGLKFAPKAKLPPPPPRFQSLRAFDDWYEDHYRPDDLLDQVELRAQFEEHLSQWYSEQGFYYEPDYAKMHGNFAEAGPMRATQIDVQAPAKYFDEESRKLAARNIELLQWTVQRVPDPADHITVWIGGSTATALVNADIFTLFTLCDHIRKRGASWWKSAPGLGPVRAKRIQQWILEIGVKGFPIDPAIFDSIQLRRTRERMRFDVEHPPLPSQAKLQLEPLSPYVENPRLNGQTGVFKNQTPNLLKADTDIDAIVVTLGKYADKLPTLKVYAREICRFCLWSYKEMGLPVSSIGVHEARLYREFLDNIPADWISTSPSPAPRNTSEWRPFRGQLDSVSKRKALTCVNVVLTQLMNGGYLTGNPMSGVLKHAGLDKPTMDVSRSLTHTQWQFACKVLDDELIAAANQSPKSNLRASDKGPNLRRLKAMLHLLFSTGMRRNELFKATLGDLKRITVDGQPCHLLKVTGKRNKVREVLIEQELMSIILAHLADRPKAFQDDMASQQGRAKIPLISILHNPVKTYHQQLENLPREGEIELPGSIVVAERWMASSIGALGADGMLSQFKRFFAKCTALAADAGIDHEAFEKATLHWMRHTFAHTMLDAEVDIRIAQKALGHANLNTTANYSKADVVQMIRGLRQGAETTRQRNVAIVSGDGHQPAQLD